METRDRLVAIGQVLSGIMVFVTAWMAFETRQMSRTSRDLLELERTPIITFTGLSLTRIPDAPTSTVGTVQIRILLRNPSRVPVTYDFSDIRLSCDGHTPETAFYKDRFATVNTGTTIGPNDQGHFICYPMFGIQNLQSPKAGTLEYELKYWAKGSETNREHRRLTYWAVGEIAEWVDMPLNSR